MTQEIPVELDVWMEDVLKILTEINTGVSMLITNPNSNSAELVDGLHRINASIGDLKAAVDRT